MISFIDGWCVEFCTESHVFRVRKLREVIADNFMEAGLTPVVGYPQPPRRRLLLAVFCVEEYANDFAELLQDTVELDWPFPWQGHCLQSMADAMNEFSLRLAAEASKLDAEREMQAEYYHHKALKAREEMRLAADEFEKRHGFRPSGW